MRTLLIAFAGVLAGVLMLAAAVRATTAKEKAMETRTIKIEGMHCDGCASRVKGLLENEPGVRDADVSYEVGEARVKFNEHTVGADRLRQVIEGAGYTAREAA